MALGSGTTADRANTVSVGRSDYQRQIVNVAAGTQNTDVVNVGQLKAAGVNVDTSGNVTNAFIAYDDATKGKVTLAGGTAGTTITNVKAGAVSSAFVPGSGTSDISIGKNAKVELYTTNAVALGAGSYTTGTTRCRWEALALSARS